MHDHHVAPPDSAAHPADALPEPGPLPALSTLFGQCAWFRTLAPEHQALVLAQSHVEQCEAGAVIAHRLAPSEYWIGVHRGLLKLAIFNASGRGCTFSGVPSGGWFGEGSVIKRELRKYEVVAIQRSTVLFVPVDTFHALLDTSLPFTRFVIHQLNNRMGEFIASIQNSRLLDVDARVAQSLAQLFNPALYPDTGPSLSISQEELGMLVGVSRQRINQALQQLEKLGALRLAYNQIEVVDLGALARFGMEQI
ncbi:Crp/Fnr family transcriptional regulator [Burkholderia sp. BE17]|uniref:Crp/Fnr family transcriptional regulator n=1 Tax=Burkholderia sp. BE17 TaxID=2656644 RepID=UPI00128E4742|nr:Crp/Fnr family transcriptional regulator [Burkholderia sp. BE17]MPV66645.1 helix-turn-helix domain-containing protein [Burkholderia sp. BE17]